MKMVIDDYYIYYFCKQYYEYDFLKYICVDLDDGFFGVGWFVIYFCFLGSFEVYFGKLISLNFLVGGFGF